MTDDAAPADPTPPDGASDGGSDGNQPGGVDGGQRDRVIVRRSPRYGRFIILGAGLGAAITFALTNLFPIDSSVGFGALFGYFLLFGVPVGAALGGLLAVLLDAATSRRATQLDAERVGVDPPQRLSEDDPQD